MSSVTDCAMISGDQWEKMKDLAPGREETVGVTAKDNYLVPRCAGSDRGHCLGAIGDCESRAGPRV
jgi:hypothetical protein